MALSNTWKTETSIYKLSPSYAEPSFIEVEICEDIVNSDYRAAYITKKILKGTENIFFKSLGEKCTVKNATSFAYMVDNTKIVRYYYNSKNAVSPGSLIADLSGIKFIVIQSNNKEIQARNKKGDIFWIERIDITVLRY